MREERIYQLALSALPQVGPVQAKILLQHFNPPEIFRAKKSMLERIEGIGPARAAAITGFRDFSRIEKEILFLGKYHIKPLFITDPEFPKRLLNCYDAPVLLFYKGTADLNAERILSVIGTRNNSNYAKHFTDKLIADLSDAKVTIASGLAFGVDGLAHKAALCYGLPTVGVLAHGLDQVYPGEHAQLAKDMIKEGGGLLTEFFSETKPDRHHFPSRNRIVAGMSDATIVIESGDRGGSLITADLANGYNRDVFAVPGKTTDAKSTGCNSLIKTNKAMLLTGAADLLAVMGWENNREARPKVQKEMFLELSSNEQLIVTILEGNSAVDIDTLKFRSGLSSSAVAEALLSLEIQNAILSLPGKQYRLP